MISLTRTYVPYFSRITSFLPTSFPFSNQQQENYINITDLTKKLGNERPLFQDLSFSIIRGLCVNIIKSSNYMVI